VAASIQRAITERRHEDAGHPEWSLWLVRGTVTGRSLDLLLDTHSEPESLHAYIVAVEVRGELVPSGNGTRLVARASTPGTSWELPFGLGIAGFFGLLFLLLDSLEGVAMSLVLLAATILLWLAMVRLISGHVLRAVPQVEAVLERVGTPSGA
jgi:hypothetical protein